MSNLPALHFSSDTDESDAFDGPVHHRSITSPRQVLETGKASLIQCGTNMYTIIVTTFTFFQQHDVATWSCGNSQVFTKTIGNKTQFLYFCNM
jgi:hypothetical protein